MAQKPSGQTALDYCKKHPLMSTFALAKKLKKEHPLLYTSIESARDYVRTYRGTKGKLNRENIKDKSCFVEPKAAVIEKVASCKIPQSLAKPILPYLMPADCKNILVLCDIHFPWHSEAALDLAIEHGINHKIDGIILLGDIIDFYGLSSFSRKPDGPTIKLERAMTVEFLEELRRLFPTAKIVYKAGNHELRMERYLCDHAPELWGMEEFELKSILDMFRLNIDYVDPTRIIKVGHLNLLHGHEISGGMMAPVNPARGAFLRTTDIVAMGHTHKSSQHTETDLNGKMISCWSIGCLCGLQPEYRPVANKWNHGFARIERSGCDFFSFHNYKIIGEKQVVAA